MAISDPAGMTADQRRTELVGLLAAGFIRMRSRKGYVPLAAKATEKGSESFGKELSESTGCVRKVEAQCHPRGPNATRKGR